MWVVQFLAIFVIKLNLLGVSTVLKENNKLLDKFEARWPTSLECWFGFPIHIFFHSYVNVDCSQWQQLMHCPGCIRFQQSFRIYKVIAETDFYASKIAKYRHWRKSFMLKWKVYALFAHILILTISKLLYLFITRFGLLSVGKHRKEKLKLFVFS